jgi:hypothetical protein
MPEDQNVTIHLSEISGPKISKEFPLAFIRDACANSGDPVAIVAINRAEWQHIRETISPQPPWDQERPLAGMAALYVLDGERQIPLWGEAGIPVGTAEIFTDMDAAFQKYCPQTANA